MKKALSCILVLILLISMAIPATAAGKPTVSISSGEVKAGESVTLTVSIEDNPGIGATMLFLYYDTSVFDVDVERDVKTIGEFESEGIALSNSIKLAKQNASFRGDPMKDGILVGWFSTSLDGAEADGDVLKVTFHTKADALNGEHKIELAYSSADTADVNAKKVSLNCKSGKLTVKGGSNEKKEEHEKPVSGNDRLSDAIVLRIGNYGAVAHGALKAIDEENYNVTPIINGNDRTLVPIRFVAESLGAAVSWDAELRQITIEMAEKTVVMKIGSRSYTVNGEQKTMDTAPEIVADWGRTMVPIRFVAEALGMAVEWDAANRMVLITPENRPWDLEGEAEAEAISEVFQLMMLQSFL